jgi:hypothetical protein
MLCQLQFGNAGSLDHPYYKERLHYVMDGLLATAVSNFTPTEQAIYHSIEIRLLDSTQMISPRGSIVKGRRIIEISTGFLALLENLTAVELHAEIGLGWSCNDQYFRFVFKAITDGYSPLEFCLHPEDNVETQCGCRNFSYSNMISSTFGRKMIGGAFNLALTFILLHEVAHHVFGDTRTTIAYSAAMEIAADEWALSSAWRARINFTVASPLFAYILFNDERRYSDKFPVNRFDALVSSLVTSTRSGDIFSADIMNDVADSFGAIAGRFKDSVLNNKSDLASVCGDRI